jgi:hypothetical protein
MVKNEINVVFLKDIAESITEVYEPSGCFLDIKLSRNLLNKKYFGVNIYSVTKSVIAGKLKLKPKNVSIQNDYKFRIHPYDTSEREMIFVLKNLKNKLGDVIVGGIPTIRRALISKAQDSSDLVIFAEG